MDREPLKPREVRFGISDQPNKRERFPAFKFFFTVLVLTVFVYPYYFPHNPAPGSNAQTVQVPAEPTPPGSWATISDDPKDVQLVSVAFAQERIEIFRVPPSHFSEEDRARAFDVDSNSAARVFRNGRARMIFASRFGDAKSDGAASPTTRQSSSTDGLQPYIFHGDVDIQCGELNGNDAGYTAFLLEGGSLSRASIYLSDGTPRGPPVNVRRVYIMGAVHKVAGPEQFQRSVLYGDTLDLSPTENSIADYRKRMQLWNDQVAQLELKVGVPAEQLRKFAGQNIRVRKGQVIGHFEDDADAFDQTAEEILKDDVTPCPICRGQTGDGSGRHEKDVDPRGESFGRAVIVESPAVP